jgi:hypothetical protein
MQTAPQFWIDVPRRFSQDGRAQTFLNWKRAFPAAPSTIRQAKAGVKKGVRMFHPIQHATITGTRTTWCRSERRIQNSPVFVAVALAALALSSGAFAQTHNTEYGDGALNPATTGSDNTALGFDALFGNTTGSRNTATGSDALFGNTEGIDNTASGASALYSNTVGYANTASGHQALYYNSGGFRNTAAGNNALFNNLGNYNTANGADTLRANTSGANNTGTGCQALFSNTTGMTNTASGVNSLYTNTEGEANTADGVQALFSNVKGDTNTAIGFSALFRNTSGSNNVALGAFAGSGLTTGSNNIDIVAPGAAGESGTIRIGKSGTHHTAFMQGIYGTPVSSGVAVVVNSGGKLGVATSSARYKEEIKPMNNASEALLALKPVTFRYKTEIDPDKQPQFGLVAEEVEKVNPDLVARDENGKVFTVRYDAVNAMLLNEFLKEHRKVEEQETRLGKQGATIARQQAQIDALTAGLQKVNDQIQLRDAKPQVAATTN